MIYKCNCCNSVFSTPKQKKSYENVDGERGWWLRVDLVCPHCGEENLEEVKTRGDE